MIERKMSNICHQDPEQLEQQQPQAIDTNDKQDNDKQQNVTKEKENPLDLCHFSEKKNIEAECERLLKNIKRQVKQMMEEAVTRKFIHEDSCSIIALCVAVDACLAHGLKRRTLDQLFKANSTTCLIQKVAKNLEEAQLILDMVEAEEKRSAAEQHQQVSRRLSLAATFLNGPSEQQSNSSQQQSAAGGNQNPTRQPIQRSPSNSGVYRRNMWIKYALIENKLVGIVDYLGKNASKYYEADALMSNYLCAQILSSLLVGLSALDFSRGKTNTCYQFDEPTADELMRRHKLINPIACMCSHRQPSMDSSRTDQCSPRVGGRPGNRHQILSRSATDSTSATLTERRPHLNEPHEPSVEATPVDQHQQRATCRPSNANSNKIKPLALKTSNLKCGTLITDCHHYSCQEISEHQPKKGYSFLWCSSSNGFSSSACSSPSSSNLQQQQHQQHLQSADSTGRPANQRTSADWPLWSPRMLHETLHQNSRSHLLYAKNNVLLEMQPDQRIAGYLSLHQTHSDLVLKWIPNRMINGGQHVISMSTNNEEDEQLSSSSSSLWQTPGGEPLVGRTGADPLDCFYLDLVVNLSLSRVVLLQCQLQRNPISQSSSLDHQQQGRELKADHRHGRRQKSVESPTGGNQKQANEIGPDTRALELLLPEESLILIEADGVQRPPFKFPKGGLRSLIACLEQGLAPDRRLELAIRFNEREDPAPADSPSLPRSPSRLDRILGRLPSARRKQQASQRGQTDEEGPEGPKTVAISADGPPDGCPLVACTQSTGGEHQGLEMPTMNYIYRIVGGPSASLSSSDGCSRRQDTPPPLSAASLNSSSSGSMGCAPNSSNGHGHGNNSLNQRRNRRGDLQQFRWSLSRLARFSTATSKGDPEQPSMGSSIRGGEPQSAPVGAPNVHSIFGDSSSLDRTIDETTDPIASELASDSIDKGSNSISPRELDRPLDEDVLLALRTQSVRTLCDSMRKQIVSRAFYGWLTYCRKMRIIRLHLIKLLNDDDEGHELDELDSAVPRPSQPNGGGQLAMANLEGGLTRSKWRLLMSADDQIGASESHLSRLINGLVYYGGIRNDSNDADADSLRREVWPYLLEHYQFKDGPNERLLKDRRARELYESCGREWIRIERVVKQRDRAILEANMARANRDLRHSTKRMNEDKAEDEEESNGNDEDDSITNKQAMLTDAVATDSCDEGPDEPVGGLHEKQPLSILGPGVVEAADTKEPTDGPAHYKSERETTQRAQPAQRKSRQARRARLESTGSVGSDASITDQFGNNIHRIDKDVQRCDRSFWYFKELANLDKLRNIMCTYVWQHLDVGYVQGMCDLAAPFLVIFDDEVLAYSCFSQLMKRMVANFPHGCAMDQHFESLQHLMQVLDPKLYEIFQTNGDYTHFYFCYRWLLLDFKRELVYEDVYRVWEVIWSARKVVTEHFVVFMALAMVRYYRDIIIENNMDFTDTIKFFNEMAEKHDACKIMALARDCVAELQAMIR